MTVVVTEERDFPDSTCCARCLAPSEAGAEGAPLLTLQADDGTVLQIAVEQCPNGSGDVAQVRELTRVVPLVGHTDNREVVLVRSSASAPASTCRRRQGLRRSLGTGCLVPSVPRRWPRPNVEASFGGAVAGPTRDGVCRGNRGHSNQGEPHPRTRTRTGPSGTSHPEPVRSPARRPVKNAGSRPVGSVPSAPRTTIIATGRYCPMLTGPARRRRRRQPRRSICSARRRRAW